MSIPPQQAALLAVRTLWRLSRRIDARNSDSVLSLYCPSLQAPRRCSCHDRLYAVHYIHGHGGSFSSAALFSHWHTISRNHSFLCLSMALCMLLTIISECAPGLGSHSRDLISLSSCHNSDNTLYAEQVYAVDNASTF